MKSRSRILSLGVSLAVALCLLTGCSKLLIEKGFPVYSGNIQVSGLRQSVEIYRDRHGIPHIYAQGEHDLYFAQGYVHAQDRLWQMEQNRRLARGRLSEIVGSSTVEIDMFMRLIGADKALDSLPERMGEQSRPLAQAYCDGVNAYIRERESNLPLEFRTLKFVPEPFSMADTFAPLILNSWFLGHNFAEEMLVVKVMNRVSPSAFDELFPSYPGARLPADDYFREIHSLSVAPFLPAIEALSQASQGARGSNGWVVSGERSASGAPLLANDPHCILTVPSIWYLNHLNCPGTHVAGVTMPGSPGVTIGHNEHVAWGITSLRTDYVDLYVVRVDPERPARYSVGGKMKEMETEQVTIRVKGGPPVIRQIYRTDHGPVITQIGKGEAQIALRWYEEMTDRSPDAFYLFNHAETVDDIVKAAREVEILGMNLVAADKAGSIVRQATGKVPIRSGYSGRLPADGNRGDHRWQGFVPYEQLPSLVNPPENLAVAANDPPFADGYPHAISYAWSPPYRARRIRQLLEQEPKLSLTDLRGIHADRHSLQAEKLIPLMDGLSPENREARWALGELRRWDREVTADSRAAAVYEIFLAELIRNLLADELGDNLHQYCHCTRTSCTVVDAVFSKPDSALWDRIDTPAQETRESILAASLADVVAKLTELLGPDRGEWRWGEVHQIHYKHPGASGFARRYLNRGPHPLGGDSNTVNCAGFTPADGGLDAVFIPALRMLIDMAAVDKCQIIAPMGQSGQPQHRHYSDLIERWRNVEYLPLHFARRDVVANQKELLVLRPDGGPK